MRDPGRGRSPATRTVEGHPDFARLEARLIDLVSETKKASARGVFAPVLVLVPTTRLRSYLQALLGKRCGALLNVAVLDYNSLTRECLRGAGIDPPATLTRRAAACLLETCFRKTAPRLADYVRDCPGALGSLFETIKDLREAGVAPGAWKGIEGLTPRGREILTLYGAYGARMEGLGGSGGGPKISDRAGAAREARDHVGTWACRFERVIHYGAYELIGSNLDLMRAIEEAGTPVAWLIPWHPSAPAFAYARRFLGEFLGEGARLLEDGKDTASPAISGTDRLLGDRLHILYDDEAVPPPAVESPGLSLFHAQGAEAELREAALRILALVRDGTAAPRGGPGGDTGSQGPLLLSEVAIVARSLAPYAHLLEPVLHGRFGIPFTTSASLEAVTNPHVMAALNLARVVLDDCERQPLLDLARSGLLVPSGGVDPFERADEWDLIARRFRIVRGRESWTTGARPLLMDAEPWLAADADERTREAAERRRKARLNSIENLTRCLDDLFEAAGGLEEATTWPGWAGSLTSLLESRLRGFERSEGSDPSPGARIVYRALAEMKQLEPAGVPFPRGRQSSREALRRLEVFLREARVPIDQVPAGEDGRDNGGVRVLDAGQARGLAFDHVFLIGFNADLIPRRPREDPFLGETDRGLLRASLSRPVPVKAAGREEEHLLLAHLLGSARRSLTISWQRADETGRARVESLALREVARVSLGGPEMSRALDASRTHRVPAHPADAAAEILDTFGLMPLPDARAGAFLGLGSPASALRHRDRLGEDGLLEKQGPILPGLEMLAAIEAFEPRGRGALRYDAIVGAEAAPPPETWSPTRLESLGNCPQQYFFRYQLRVNEIDAVLEEHEVDMVELGRLAHRVLQDVYAALVQEGFLSGSAADGTKAVRRGLDLLERKWTEHFSEVAAVIHRRFPVMWRGLSRLWKNSLQTFLLHDLDALERSGSRVLSVEAAVEATLSLGKGSPPMAIHGRTDRVVRDAAGGRLVADYKTMGNIANRVDPNRILKGRSLQLPLYFLMHEAGRDPGLPPVQAEVIGVGPAYSEGAPPSEPGPEGYPSRLLLGSGPMERIREGLLETLRILAESAGAGSYPLNPDSIRCGWCPYRRACRRGHEPTLTRLAAVPGVARYLALSGKSRKAPLLAAATQAGGAGE